MFSAPQLIVAGVVFALVSGVLLVFASGVQTGEPPAPAAASGSPEPTATAASPAPIPTDPPIQVDDVAEAPALPVGAATTRLYESSRTNYTVRPSRGEISVNIYLKLKNEWQKPSPAQDWGPVVVDERATEFEVAKGIEVVEGSPLPGPWKELWVRMPRLKPGGAVNTNVKYVVDAAPSAEGSPERGDTRYFVDRHEMRFCIVGQDTDKGGVGVYIADSDPWVLDIDQSDTPLEAVNERGWEYYAGDAPGEVYTCFEGVRSEPMLEAELISEDPGVPAPLAAARTDALTEWHDGRYVVYPAQGQIEVVSELRFENPGERSYPSSWWGPLVVDESAGPVSAEGVSTARIRVREGKTLPGPWKELFLKLPRIKAGGSAWAEVRYTIATVNADGTPFPVVGPHALHFCVTGQDSDSSEVRIYFADDDGWTLTQSGTRLESNGDGLEALSVSESDAILTCIEGTRAATDTGSSSDAATG